MHKIAILLLISVFSISALKTDRDYDDDDLECNVPLLESSVLSATTSLNERGPENARLEAKSAWTPVENTYYQALTIELGSRKKIKKMTTLGRPHTDDYVTELIIQYSDDGDIWRTYSDNDGQDQLFKGNENGDTKKHNVFDVPIIAQWIRINPTRWKDRISLRVELYGCEYYAETVYFNGTSLMSYDLLRDPISASRETVQFRFKTSHANGVLMYSKGTQGDFFALQLYENRMILNINLGASAMSSFSVGSLLDDNVWHDVVISRNRRDILLSVDRVVVDGKIKGDFDKLDLNRMLYFGGTPAKDEGMVVTQNFTGCMENLYLNRTNYIREMKEAYREGQYSRFERVNVLENCPEPPIMPVTFLTRTSYAKLKGYEGVRSMNISLAFRTYEDKGLIIYHEFSSKGFVKVFLEDGRVKTEIKTDEKEIHSTGDPRRGIILDNYDEHFNDGRWHTLVFTMKQNSIVIEIDQRPMRTEKLFTMITGPWYYIGGSKTKEIHNIINNRDGFIGCMRQISVDGNFKLPHDWKEDDYCCKGEILMDACHMIDRCNPNPCKHSGNCRQNSYEFFCECGNSGYSGAVCHTSLNPLSCQAYKNIQSVSQKAFIKIDVDGSGPLDPFEVTCEFLSDGRVLTTLGHSSEHSTVVDSFQEPGSYDQTIEYNARMPQIEALLNRSRECSQRLTYSCRSARLFNSPSDEQTFRPFGWWLSRQNQMMDYWAGALPGSRKCQCGMVGNCIDPTKWCNCDANMYDWQEDGGEIKEKEYLPVRGLRFGDTGTALDEKQAKYTLGPLVCEGDDLFNNVVTFRITDATINIPRFDMGHSGDIYLEFKTTQENAVIFHSKGSTDFIKLSLIAGNKLKFQYQAGSGPLGVDVETSYPLNDNNWHSVSVERNRKEARLVVDGATKSEVREPPGPVRALYLTSELAIGATLDYQDGFVGCIRALLLNGILTDLKSHAERLDRYGRKPYGISPGCIGRCESSPCLNNGTCFEKYDGFHCDCRWSSFKGPICADEIGVNLRSDSIIKYDFLGSWRSTIQENIRVGFTTTNQKGFLLGFSSNITGEYLTILVSNSGALKFVFDFGFERQEISYPNVHFGLGQYHDVRFQRKNSGSTVVVSVDNYEPKEYKFDIKDSADAQFNNIQYMYIGKNESMTDGFVGCVSRVEFDDIFPLKLLFQQNPPANVKSLGPSTLTEDFCGVEPVTLPPVVKETRPPPIVDADKISSYDGISAGFLGGLLFIILLLLLIVAILIYRHMSRHKGEYLTQEDKGADDALDQDDAVVHSTTGHHVTKKKEWFI